MNKKGDVSVLKVFFGMVLGLVVLFILYMVWTPLYSIAAEHDDNEDYINLIKTINSLKTNEEREIIYYINSRNFLVGFNPQQKEVQGIKKTDSCDDNSVCICKCPKEDKTCSSAASVCNNINRAIINLRGIYTGQGKTTVWIYKSKKSYIEDKGLFIKGKNKLILDLIRDNNQLRITTPQQK